MLARKPFPRPPYRWPTIHFPDIDRSSKKKYRLRQAQADVDMLGYCMPPFTYTQLDFFAQTVAAVPEIDSERPADPTRRTTFNTHVADVTFEPDGD